MRAEEFKLPKEKFVLVNEDKKLHDKELVTKPVGFFKDAMYRFAKNKGSIVGAIVIGILILYSLIAPIFSPYTVSYNDVKYRYTLPKWFSSEKVDFIDGASNKKGNLNTLVYYYSMGVETGHNALKRQEWKTAGDSGLYSYRLDSYHSAGTVFMNFSQNEYNELQNYQDDNDVQIIYPITTPALRPEAPQDQGNANYWYKTVKDGSLTAPDGYTIKEDGTIEYENIYKAYAVPEMECLAKNVNPAHITFKTMTGGYALEMAKFISADNEKGTVDHYESLGYFKVEAAGDLNPTFFTNDIEDATPVHYDTTKKTLVFEVNDHDDATLDGEYILGVDAKSGSSVVVIPIAEYTDVNYIPFTLNTLDSVQVDDIDTNSKYLLTANRQSSTTNTYLLGSFVQGFSTTTGTKTATVITFINSGTGYKFQFKAGKFTRYLKAELKDSKIALSAMTSEADGSIFNFDATNSGLYIEIGGTKYYFTVDFTNLKEPVVDLLPLTSVDGVNVFTLVANNKVGDTFEIKTDMADGDSFYLSYKKTTETNRHYFANGSFKGDNYYSKMRIEGEDEYQYSYAIQKDGSMYEVRVNYYEYYRYFHRHILHDRIATPFFLFGTTSYGQDIFTCLASGARFSFAFAIVVAIVNMIVGAIYGALEGYYGGKVDIILERIVEILSAVPFMIVITLMKYHMEHTPQALILFIAFFATGWIGMSGLVRMQFYRFKNQEYVLASRTLGAKDLRIMFKHIFPNSLGTIVTSSVLVIPGMIFSETSLSYLGIINLSTSNITSVGTLLAGGQPYLVTYPHMILFPAIFISLLMLCFNLFGNGLRDAFNPSLRGTED